MPVELSSLDRALLHRAARHLEEEAAAVKRSHEPWGGAEGRLEKRRYMRDARDLRALGRRHVTGGSDAS
jgi:hypothetical protein